MTEGQVRYQTFAENQRHNMEMENIQRYGTRAQAAQAQAQAAYTRAISPYAEEKAKQDAKRAKYEASAAYWDFAIKGSQAIGGGFSAARNGFGILGDVISTGGKAVSLFG